MNQQNPLGRILQEAELAALHAEFSRPVPGEYAHLIRNIRLFEEQDDFTGKLYNRLIGRPETGTGLITAPNGDTVGITEEGTQIKDLISGRDFFDFGSGEVVPFSRTPSTLRMSRLAQMFGARRYIGVDIDLIHELCGSERDGFSSYWIRDDLLSFASRIPETAPGKVFFLSGIEVGSPFDTVDIPPSSPAYQQSAKLSLDYFNALWQEVRRVTLEGDPVIIHRGGTPYDPWWKLLEHHGFQMIESRGRPDGLPGRLFPNEDTNMFVYVKT